MVERGFPQWGPDFLKEFNEFRQQLNELLNSVFSGDVQLASRAMHPVVDIAENDQNYTYFVEIPGVDKADIKLMVKDGTLYLSGERKEPRFSENCQKIREELPYGKFQRALPLPQDADLETIKARYEDGILLIVIDKRAETRPKKIDVKIQ